METDNHIIHTVDSVIVHMHQLACGLKGSSGAATYMYSYPHVHMYSYLHVKLPTCTATYMYACTATYMYSYPHVHMYSYLHVQLHTCTATYMYKTLSPGQEIVITRVVYGQWRLI